jgi:hypothetical protein
MFDRLTLDALANHVEDEMKRIEQRDIRSNPMNNEQLRKEFEAWAVEHKYILAKFTDEYSFSSTKNAYSGYAAAALLRDELIGKLLKHLKAANIPYENHTPEATRQWAFIARNEVRQALAEAKAQGYGEQAIKAWNTRATRHAMQPVVIRTITKSELEKAKEALHLAWRIADKCNATESETEEMLTKAAFQAIGFKIEEG